MGDRQAQAIARILDRDKLTGRFREIRMSMHYRADIACDAIAHGKLNLARNQVCELVDFVESEMHTLMKELLAP